MAITPSKEDYAKHFRTQLHYICGCTICVKAKRKSPRHHRGSGDLHRGVPLISVDYTYLSDPKNKTVWVAHDSESQGVWAIAADFKGESEDVANQLCNIAKPKSGIRQLLSKLIKNPVLPKSAERLKNSCTASRITSRRTRS